jgi:hypothetical protein
MINSTQLSEMKKMMTSERHFMRASRNKLPGTSGLETGDSLAFDQSSAMGGPNLFQSRASSQMHNAARGLGRDHGAMSQMSESVDDFNSNIGGFENPYDHPSSLNLPKLISKQNLSKNAGQHRSRAEAREWADNASSATGI